jgi:hypothetical protein
VYVDYLPEEEDDETEQDEFYVYVRGDTAHVYEFPMDVYRAVVDYRPNFWHLLVGSGTVPGLIAVLITITICYLALAGDSEKIPQVLGAALTTILGFYFGSKASQR